MIPEDESPNAPMDEVKSFKKIIRDRYERILSEIEDDIGLFQMTVGGTGLFND